MTGAGVLGSKASNLFSQVVEAPKPLSDLLDPNVAPVPLKPSEPPRGLFSPREKRMTLPGFEPEFEP